jgi:hypothetical protein
MHDAVSVRPVPSNLLRMLAYLLPAADGLSVLLRRVKSMLHIGVVVAPMCNSTKRRMGGGACPLVCVFQTNLPTFLPTNLPLLLKGWFT